MAKNQTSFADFDKKMGGYNWYSSMNSDDRKTRYEEWSQNNQSVEPTSNPTDLTKTETVNKTGYSALTQNRMSGNDENFNKVSKKKLDEAQKAVGFLEQRLAADPDNEGLQQELQYAKQQLAAAQTRFNTTAVPGGSEVTSDAINNPNDVASKGKPVNIKANENQFIDEGTGQAQNYYEGQAGQVGSTVTVNAPNKTDANTYDPTKVAGKTQEELGKLDAEQGKVSDKAQVTAAEMSPDELAQLGLSPAQIEQYQQVVFDKKRKLEAGEAVEGSAVDMQKVNEQAQFEAAQANPSKQATVQGQLEGLMDQFEGGNTPPWASGAMRQAMATLQSRGLGASSLAGQAVVQAAMESALPIAMADAQTKAQFEQQNLSNRQQAALFGAQQRAQFLGMEFDQEFQSRVINASKISEIANMNFTAEQQIALENARLAQSVDLANLDARNAKVLADAAALTQVDVANLNNRQQARVQNARSFLEMDLKNLDNRQQTSLFKSQQMINSMLSDQAAENAAKQFNAASENQTDQFFADLEANVQKFNADQKNAIAQFNAGEEGATSRFNSQMRNQREQFNAQNSLIIAQANAKWRQDIATANSGRHNENNMEFAKTMNALTAAAMDNVWQRERDLMSFAWQSAENAEERNLRTLLADKDLKAVREQIDAEEDAALGALAGKIFFGGGGLF